MGVKTVATSYQFILMASFAGAGLCAASATPASATEFQKTNLVSDIPGLAKFTDPDLVNAWGISEGPSTPFWISDNGTGVSTLYAVPGSTPPVTKQGLTVTIPGAVTGTKSAPTGQVFNNTLTGFDLGVAGKPLFLFDSEDGAISGWNPSLGTTAAIAVNNSASGAVYKGLAIDNSGGNLYAANFNSGRIEKYDSSFTQVKTFTDPTLPAGYAPFDAKVIKDINGNGVLYVTFALQDPDKHDDVAGLGNGFVDVFNLDGTLDMSFGVNGRLISGGVLNSPWGLQIAPSSFGSFAGDLLVGNFGNGMINAFDPTTGAFAGTLDGTNGQPLSIDGLWALTVGNGAAGGSLNALYFTAGPNGESDGLFGSLTAVPEVFDLGDDDSGLRRPRFRRLSSLAQVRRDSRLRVIGTHSLVARPQLARPHITLNYGDATAPRTASTVPRWSLSTTRPQPLKNRLDIP